MKLKRLFGFVVLPLLGFSMVGQEAVAGGTTVCGVQAIPSGYVVVERGYNPSLCGTNINGDFNAMVVRPPVAPNDTVCDPQPNGNRLPAGWRSVARNQYLANCKISRLDTSSINAQTITNK